MANDPEINIDITIGHAKLASQAKKAGKTIGEIGKAALSASGNATSLSKAFTEFGNSGKSLPALRYALYDIRNTLLGISLAFGAAAIGPVKFSIDYERAFANVIRTNELGEDSAKQLRKQLQTITETTPISWADITNIAALAGQLGVAEKYVAGFTETVAKFSATTDLTVDAAATAFGRLNQLIEGVDGNFESLGSSILAVGVDSVATESQIVAVSTQIAAMGNLAGLTAPEIVGLSGAMASVGIKPELARGNITRLFSEIGKSAVTGGREVEEFGRLTGRSADDFVSDWQTQPGRVIQDFFDGINDEGPRAERTLRELGITSVRDIPAILRLAQTSDEVRRLIALSSDEFLRGSKINQQYGVISQTTGAQLDRLAQNFQTLGAAFGDGVGPLGSFVSLLNDVVQGITRFTQTGFGQVVAAGVIIVSLFIAAFTGLVAIVAGTAASILALRFAVQKLGFDSLGAAAKVAVSNKSIDALGVKSRFATIGLLALSAAVKSLLIATGVGIVLLALGAIFASYGSKTSEASSKTKELYGDLEALNTAIQKDTEAFDKNTGKMKDGTEALKVYSREVTITKESLIGALDEANEFAAGADTVTAAVEGSTGAIEEQTRVLDENAVAYFKNQMLKDSDVVDLFADSGFQEAAFAAGVTVDELIAAGISGEGGAIVAAINEQLEIGLTELENQRDIIRQTQGDAGPEYAAATQAIKARKDMIESTTEVIGDHTKEQYEQVKADEAVTKATEFSNGAQQDAKTYIDLTDESVKILMDDLFGLENANKKTAGAFADLGEEFAGLDGDSLTAQGAIQGVIASVLAGTPDAEQQIINLAQSLLIMESAGVVSSVTLALVQDAIDGVALSAGIGTERVTELLSLGGTRGSLDGASDALAAGMDRVGKSAGGAAKKVKTLNEQFDDLVDSMFEATNLGRDTEEAIFDLGEAFGETGDEALYASEEMQDAIGSILAQSGSAEEGVANLASLFAGLASTVGGQAAPALQVLRQAISQVAAQFGITEAAAQSFINTAGGGIATINFDNFNRGIRAARQEVRTLLDFAGDLENVFSRAFDLRFATTFDIDNIADAWQNLSETVEDARYQVEELLASQQDLGADRALKEYFLSVAEAYGDTLRAAQLRKELSELNRDDAKAARDLAEAQQVSGGVLTGDGAGARANRGALLGLVQEYQGYIATLAESGASQDELREATEKARRQFTEQARELGFQEDVVQQYAAAFDDVRTAIDNVPRNITVEANVNPALQALNELNASLQKQISAANDLNRALNQPVTTPSGGGGNGGPGTTPSKPAFTQPGFRPTPLRPGGSRTPVGDVLFGRVSRITITPKTVQFVSPRTIDRGFSDGGFTGRGGMMQPAGVVHKGEYVVPQKYVNQSTGLPDANFLAQLQNGMRSFSAGSTPSGGGGNDGGTMMVELSPFDRKLLADAGNVQLRLNGKVVAEATNRSNVVDAQRGAN